MARMPHTKDMLRFSRLTFARKTESGYFVESFRKISGCSTMFHVSMKLRMHREATPDFAYGTMILHSI